MFDYIHNENAVGQDSGIGIREVVAIFSMIVAIVSLGTSLYSIFLVKKMEITIAKFNRLCIVNFDNHLSPLESKIENYPSVFSLSYKQEVTNFSTDFQVYLVNLKKVNYPFIDINEIISILENFSEFYYNLPAEARVQESKGEFILMKLKIQERLYDYALKKELNFFERIFYK